MSIDDSVQRDPRITKLAKLAEWSRRETLGCLVGDVWPITYDQKSAVISADLVDLAAGLDGFAQHMVSAELAKWVRGNRRVRISGAEERLKYLADKTTAGRVGGLRSAEVRNKISSSTGSTPQAERNPPVPDPVLVLVPDPVPDPAPVLREDSDTPTAVGSRHRRAKPSEPTPEERAVADRVLAKLSERNGVRYSGNAEHLRLITAQLRAGVPEMDLRYVVGYCADELGWEDDPDKAKYLRPETLFGPKTIARYLDPARTWVAKHKLAPSQGATP